MATPSELRFVSPFGRLPRGLLVVGAVTVASGLAFGYDQGVVGGALTFIQDDFDLQTLGTGGVVSSLTFGALVGALATGPLAETRGRTGALVVGGSAVLAGGVLSALTPGVYLLMLGRLVSGFGIGVASVAGPLYAAESSPPSERGRLVSTFQLAITVGILIAMLIDVWFTGPGNWRAMLGLSAVAGALLLVLAALGPRSPRWLLAHGDRDAARRSWAETMGTADIEERLDGIERELADEPAGTWREVFAPQSRRPLVIGFGLAVFSQLTGINAIIYYSNQILDKAGFSTTEQQVTASLVAVGVVNVLATFVAIAFVDRMGRRPLLHTGMVGMGVGFAGLCIWSVWNTEPGSAVGQSAMIWMVVVIASFAFSLGPLTYTVISEIFPTSIRSKGMAVATAGNWGSAYILALVFPALLDDVGTTPTYAGLSIIAFIALAWSWRNVPETKGKSLEEISEMLAAR